MREVLHLTPEERCASSPHGDLSASEELALWPPGASLERGDLGWRVARVTFDRPGRLARLPGCDRILIVTRGEGLMLDHGEHAPRARVGPLEPYRFGGDWPTTTALPARPTGGLDVTLRRDRSDAEVQVLRLGRRRLREALPAGHAVAHVVVGSAVVRVTGEEGPFALGAGESLWARGLLGAEELELTGEDEACVVLLVGIHGSPVP